MGIAIIASGVSFADKGLGRVTPTEDIDIVSITAINGETENTSNSVTYTAVLNPANTSQRRLVWTFADGSTTIEGIASIVTNADNTATVSVLDNASASAVTIKATSYYKPNVSATKAVTLTHIENWLVNHSQYKNNTNPGYRFNGKWWTDSDLLALRGQTVSMVRLYIKSVDDIGSEIGIADGTGSASADTYTPFATYTITAEDKTAGYKDITFTAITLTIGLAFKLPTGFHYCTAPDSDITMIGQSEFTNTCICVNVS